ncbi:MAG: hypothetical protein QOG99_984 [Frankiales bacterium]|jgi:hypothetical protein|nr:hypothetical protein [Frankiales bacterium]
MDLNKLLKTQWDRAGAIGLTGLGALFLLFGWIGVSGTALLAEQSPYILSGGVGGVFLLGIGSTLWISADLRDEWRKLDRIEAAIGEGVLRWEEGAEAAAAPAFTARRAPEVSDSIVDVSAAKAARSATTAPRRTPRAKATAATHDA